MLARSAGPNGYVGSTWRRPFVHSYILLLPLLLPLLLLFSTLFHLLFTTQCKRIYFIPFKRKVRAWKSGHILVSPLIVKKFIWRGKLISICIKENNINCINFSCDTLLGQQYYFLQKISSPRLSMKLMRQKFKSWGEKHILEEEENKHKRVPANH
jgi:hypothetical protein